MTDHFSYLLIYKLIRFFIDISSSLTQRKALEDSCGPLSHVSTSQWCLLLGTEAASHQCGPLFIGTEPFRAIRLSQPALLIIPAAPAKPLLPFSHHPPDMQPLKSGCYLSSGLVTAVSLPVISCFLQPAVSLLKPHIPLGARVYPSPKRH